MRHPRPAERSLAKPGRIVGGIATIGLGLTLLLVGWSSTGAAPVHPSFAVSLSETPGHGEAPLLVAFNATVFPSDTYAWFHWSFGDGGVFNENRTGSSSPAHQFLVPGTYRVGVVVQSSSGSANASSVVVVTSANLSVTIRSSSTSGPVPLTVTFAADVTGGSGTLTGLAWNFGDGGVGSGSNVTYTFLHAGRFRVTLNATDDHGSRAAAAVSVTAVGPTTGPGSPPAFFLGLPRIAAGTQAWLATLGSGAAIAVVGTITWKRWQHRRLSRSDTSAPSPRAGPRADAEPASTIAPGPPSASTESAEVGILPGAGLDVPSPIVGPRTGSEPGAAGADPLRLSERVLVHLFWNRTDEASGIGRPEATQQGLSRAIGAPQNTLSKVLSRLVAAGVVRSSTLHVSGASRRVKVYALTPRGEKLARGLADRRSDLSGRSGGAAP